MPEAIGPPQSTSDLAILVLQRNAAEFLQHAPGARTGKDPRHVHQMRVATRRMRAALRLFADLLPPQAASLNAELKWFAGQLGAVRDLDVQIQRMREIANELALRTALEPYATWLDAQLQGGRGKLASAFESRRFGALVQCLQRLEDWAPEARTSVHNAPVFKAGPARLRRAYRQLRKRADGVKSDSPAPALHAIRIRAKRLRYTAEFFEGAYGKPARQFVTLAVALQDLLGQLQDSVVSRAQIQAAVRGSDGAWRVESTLALGQLMQYEAEREKELRSDFPRARDNLGRKGWRPLRKALKRRA